MTGKYLPYCVSIQYEFYFLFVGCLIKKVGPSERFNCIIFIGILNRQNMNEFEQMIIPPPIFLIYIIKHFQREKRGKIEFKKNYTVFWECRKVKIILLVELHLNTSAQKLIWGNSNRYFLYHYSMQYPIIQVK